MTSAIFRVYNVGIDDSTFLQDYNESMNQIINSGINVSSERYKYYIRRMTHILSNLNNFDNIFISEVSIECLHVISTLLCNNNTYSICLQMYNNMYLSHQQIQKYNNKIIKPSEISQVLNEILVLIRSNNKIKTFMHKDCLLRGIFNLSLFHNTCFLIL